VGQHVKLGLHIALVFGLLASAAGVPAQQVLVRTTARAATREETRQTLHVADMTTGQVSPWQDTFPGMQAVTPLATSPDGAWAFLTTRALWPQPEGWPAQMAAISAVALDSPEIVRAEGGGMLLAPNMKFGCAFQQPGQDTLFVVGLESGGQDAPELGSVTLWMFSPLAGFDTTLRVTWRLGGTPVQALPLEGGRIAVLCRGSLGVSLVMFDTRTRQLLADMLLSPVGDPAQGPASPIEMAITPDKRRVLVLVSGFSLESPEGEQRSWLYQLDAATFEFIAEPEEFPGIPQTPAPSLWPLANGACWMATISPGEGFAYLYRLPLTPSAPRAVEQPFVNALGPLRVAPDPAGTAVAIGVRERLEIWPEGEPAGTPTHFENSLSFVEWCEFGILAAEAHRLHLVNPEDGAILQTAAFQSGVVAEALMLAALTRDAETGTGDSPAAGSALAAQLPDVVLFRGEAVGREQRVLNILTKEGPEVPWQIEFDAAAMPWLRAHPRSGGPGEAGFAVMGVDASVFSSEPAATPPLQGVVHVMFPELGALSGQGFPRHSIVVQVSPLPAGPRSILWLLGSTEESARLLDRAGGHPLEAATALLAGPPHWFSHRYGASPFNEPLTEHALVVLTARAASEGIVTRQALLSYVAAGGGVLFLGAHLDESKARTLADWLAPTGVHLDTAEDVSGTFDVSGAPPLCRNWGSAAIERGCRIRVDPPGTTLVRDPERGGAIFAIVPYGLGRVAVLASATPLENSALSDPTHRRFVGDLIQWLDDAGREVSDVDGDGLPDAIEDANQNAALDPGETDRFNPDTDGDGIPDGLEDRNRNGRTDEGETSAVNPDSDGDGIWDGADLSPIPPAGTPVLDAVRPAEWPAEGGIWVQLSGRNFAPGMAVRFGERPAARVRVLGPRGLEAEVPPADSPDGGTVDVVMEGREADQTGTLPGGFRYLPRSSVSLAIEQQRETGGDMLRLAISASSERSAQVDLLTFRLNTEPPRAVEWGDALPGIDALRSGRQVVSRPDPEGGIWLDISPARTGYPLGELINVSCHTADAASGEAPRFIITRARAFAPNGAHLDVQTAE